MNREPDEGGMAAEYDFSQAHRGHYSGRTYVEPGTPAGTQVVLLTALPEHGLEKGDVGRILATTPESELEVEFKFAPDADAVVAMLKPGDLRLPMKSEVLHVRETRSM